MKKLFYLFLIGLLLSPNATYAQEGTWFANTCTTKGYSGDNNTFIVELVDKTTGQKSSQCIADKWWYNSPVVSPGEEVSHTGQEFVFKIGDGGRVNFTAYQGIEYTTDKWYDLSPNSSNSAENLDVLRFEDGTKIGAVRPFESISMKITSLFYQDSQYDWQWVNNPMPASFSCGVYSDDRSTYTCKGIKDEIQNLATTVTIYAKSNVNNLRTNSLTLTLDANAPSRESHFVDSCVVKGSFGEGDIFLLDLMDIRTGKHSDECSATNWSWHSSVVDPVEFIEKGANTAKLRRISGGRVSIVAIKNTDSTNMKWFLIDRAGATPPTFSQENVSAISRENEEQPVSVGDAIPAAGYEDVVRTAFQFSPFPDTDVSSLKGKAAAELYQRGVLGGFPDGEFKGQKSVNRAETAKFLLLARNYDVESGLDNPFWDVLPNEWYGPYVLTAAKKGIIGGHPDKSFKPGDTVKTAELLKMMALTFDLPLNQFHTYSDVQNSDWFDQYAGIAKIYNLFPDRSSSRLEPGKELTRNEVAVAIYQYLSQR